MSSCALNVSVEWHVDPYSQILDMQGCWALFTAVSGRGFPPCRQDSVLWLSLITLSFRALLGDICLAVSTKEQGPPL